ncbi:MAG: S41 family peptidase [Ginsengibacter sp.]
MKRLVLAFFFALQSIFLFAQQFDVAAKNAFIVARMAEKFHVQPKPLNDEFSSHVFDQFLRQIDENKIFFTIEDINSLLKYKLEIDDEIRSRQTSFLESITKMYAARMSRADTMIDNICKTPFNFSLPEKIPFSEYDAYPVNDKAMRVKVYKTLKSAALDIILDEDTILTLSAGKQKKFLDSIEPVARQKAKKNFRHIIEVIENSPGGFEQFMGDEYCKAIAACYDPHTEYFPLSEKENFESEIGQKHMAFGFNCKENDDGSVAIDNIFPGSPAFKSGQVNKGDKILSIQWEDKTPIDVSSGGLRQLYEVLSMSNHDKATLKLRKQDGSERSVILFKEKMESDDDKVKSFLLKGTKTVGFISLPSFYQDWEDDGAGANGCANDVAKEILKLKRENIEGLIIDLRYNGGGSMQEAIELSGIFIDAGPVGMDKGRDEKMFTLKDVNRGTVYDGPLMIMVNGYTASAAEMVAGTLQDYHRAVITGSSTYGKATAQVILPMDTTINPGKDVSQVKSDSYLKLTVSQLYRVNGTTAQAKGVLPDVVLPDALDAHPQREKDNYYVLVSAPAEGNKYFKPYAATDLTKLQAVAQEKISNSSYFSKLKNYVASVNANDKKDISLQIPLAIEQEKNATQDNIKTDSSQTDKAPYTIENNLFEKQELQVNDRLKEANDQWIIFLTRDPYLKINYDLMLLMIK